MFVLLTYFGLILSVAFLVLTERAVLSLAQIRKSPNVVSPWGIIQCVADSLKLMTKIKITLSPTSVLLYTLSPPLLTMTTVILIMTCPMPMPLSFISNNILSMFCITSIMSLPFMLLGLSYSSVYSTVSSVRVVSLMMSYEILLLLLTLFFSGSFNTSNWMPFINQEFNSISQMARLGLLAPMLILWLMELSRTPFDLAESESELVSGFNVEYGSWSFLLFFFSEMLCLMTMSLMFSMMILQLSNVLSITTSMALFILVSLYVRAALPRFRLLDTQSFVWFRLTPFVMVYSMLYMFILCQN